MLQFETAKGKVDGRATTVRGKAVKVTVSKNIDAIKSVVTIGKEDPTNAESRRSIIVLEAFKGSDSLFRSPSVRKMFFPSFPTSQLVWPSALPGPTPVVNFPYRDLNPSQRAAVEFCLCRTEKRRIGLIRGPPGTGKTTVIAACVTSIIAGTSESTVWIVAQSNVAVKNVAEKLAEADFLDFRLLVSKDFHFDW